MPGLAPWLETRAGVPVVPGSDAPVKDVDEAQAKIVVAAKALADAGEIVISGQGEEDQLVY